MSYVGIVCLWCAMSAPRIPLEVLAHCTAAVQAEQDGNLAWYNDYAVATAVARCERRMVLIYFAPPEGDAAHARFVSESLADPGVRRLLERYVLLRLRTTAQITAGGQPVELLAHPAFAEMHHRPGIAVLDLEHRGAEYYGHVVSAFPFSPRRYYTAEGLRQVLELPEGTITQRTMVFAVRMHPEHPDSTTGRVHPALLSEASRHSAHQADIALQGHHQWETRFHRINHEVGDGAISTEVCAESWPGETLVEACHECVHSWRQSPGHWRAVKSRHALFGYDIRRGRNGIWYATGLFANFGR